MATKNSNNNNTLSPQFGTSILRAIKSTFRQFGQNDSIYKCELISAFRSLDLELSLSELDQLLAGACLAGKRKEADYLTRGEFAISVAELIRYKRATQSISKTNPLSSQHIESNISTEDTHYHVFLGGSCNPTTWRIKTAIPYFETHCVTYYNPQVDDWYPELIEIEEKAKRNSTIKFFVFDSETRGIASLVETAFMASIGWRLVVVLHYLPESTEVKIAGEILSKPEVKDLNRGRSFLCDILEKLGVPVFDNLAEALECTCDVIQGRTSYAHLLMEKKGTTNHQYGNWLLQLRNLFDRFSSIPEYNRSIPDTPNVDSNSILEPKRGSVPDILDVDVRRAKITLNKMTPSLTTDSAIKALELFLQTRSLHSSIQDELTLLDLIGTPIDYEVFCLFTAEAVYQHNNSIWNWSNSKITNFFKHACSLLNSVLQPSIDIIDTNLQENENIDPAEFDVFLGGTCANTVWRTKLAIPLLEANSITYYNPQLAPEEWNIRKMTEEYLAKQTSKYFLIVISTDSPSIASMTEAAYLISSSKYVFLTIEDISPTSGEFSYPITITACKDFNRGRAYLKKTAQLFNIPVFRTIEETLDSIVKYCSTRSV